MTHDEARRRRRGCRADDQRVDVDRLDLGVREGEIAQRDERSGDDAVRVLDARLGDESAPPRRRRAARSRATTRSSSSTSIPPRPTARIGPKSGSRVMPQSTSVPGLDLSRDEHRAAEASRGLGRLLGRRDAEDDAAVAGLVRDAVELDDDGRAELVRRRAPPPPGSLRGASARTGRRAARGRAPTRARAARRPGRAGRRRPGRLVRGVEGSNGRRRATRRARASRRAGRGAAAGRARARAPGTGAADRRCARSSSQQKSARARRAGARACAASARTTRRSSRSRNWERSACARRTSNSPDAAISSSERG